MAPLPLDSLLLHPKQYASDTNTRFRGLTLTKNGEGWNIVIRAFAHDGEAVYALTTASCPHEGLSRLLSVLATTKGADLWHRDKYYKV